MKPVGYLIKRQEKHLLCNLVQRGYVTSFFYIKKREELQTSLSIPYASY